jgi:hypothetical protein
MRQNMGIGATFLAGPGLTFGLSIEFYLEKREAGKIQSQMRIHP